MNPSVKSGASVNVGEISRLADRDRVFRPGLDCGYRLDFLVANLVVVEIKAIEALLPIHQAQLLSYLKLGGWKLGLLINFHAPLLREGIKRVVLGLEEVPKSTTSDA